jgi:hypothetical protein
MVELSRENMGQLCSAQLILYGPSRLPIMQGRFDRELAYFGTKIAELMLQSPEQLDGYGQGVRGELVFDGRFVAFKIVNVTVDRERMGL